MYDTLTKLNGDFLPFLTFHGTQNMNKTNSIIKYGYILPGDSHPTQGWSLRMANGNLYGDGIYTSTDFITSAWFTSLDDNLDVQLIVNLIIPGTCKEVDPYTHYNKETEYKKVIPYHNLSGKLYTDPVGEYNTVYSSDKKIWVTAGSSTIFPIATIHMKPRMDPKLAKKIMHDELNKMTYKIKNSHMDDFNTFRYKLKMVLVAIKKFVKEKKLSYSSHIDSDKTFNVKSYRITDEWSFIAGEKEINYYEYSKIAKRNMHEELRDNIKEVKNYLTKENSELFRKYSTYDGMTKKIVYGKGHMWKEYEKEITKFLLEHPGALAKFIGDKRKEERKNRRIALAQKNYTYKLFIKTKPNNL